MAQILRENSFELYEKLLDYNLVLIANESWSKCVIKQNHFYCHGFLDENRYLILEDESNFFLTFVDPVDLYFNIKKIKPQKWGFSIVNRNCILFENPTDAAMFKLYT